jgi:hypothetical protein
VSPVAPANSRETITLDIDRSHRGLAHTGLPVQFTFTPPAAIHAARSRKPLAR